MELEKNYGPVCKPIWYGHVIKHLRQELWLVNY